MTSNCEFSGKCDREDENCSIPGMVALCKERIRRLRRT